MSALYYIVCNFKEKFYHFFKRFFNIFLEGELSCWFGGDSHRNYFACTVGKVAWTLDKSPETPE